MIYISDEEREIILEILAKRISEYEIRVFGSRALGKHRKYSDLDLVVC